jgi:hypothetical protein
MKQFLIGLAATFLLLSFIGWSNHETNLESGYDTETIKELNQLVDEQIALRLKALRSNN